MNSIFKQIGGQCPERENGEDCSEDGSTGYCWYCGEPIYNSSPSPTPSPTIRLRQRQRQRSITPIRRKTPDYEKRSPIETDECSICMESITTKRSVVLNCGHAFHIECINEWRSQKGTCPLCRKLTRASNNRKYKNSNNSNNTNNSKRLLHNKPKGKRSCFGSLCRIFGVRGNGKQKKQHLTQKSRGKNKPKKQLKRKKSRLIKKK